MKIKTSELTGAALDWAVAECEFRRIQQEEGHVKPWVLEQHRRGLTRPVDWLQAGPIIERELISVEHEDGQWSAVDWQGRSHSTGPTALIAAMRCYVQSKLADEVEIPEELL